jgi:LytS/YehU family sensor histidine kinase
MLSLIAGAFLDFMLSFIVKIALAYFNLKKRSEEILLQKSHVELNLLKSQVQPHFLFNTLNNIYYEIYREAPKSAELIERLSDIMRYFVDESPKEVVSLDTEIHFIENYIELERIRMRHQIEVNFIKQYHKELRLPPMLLMTFVENLFKHGIDKASSINKIEISLIHQDTQLLFQTVNAIQPNDNRPIINRGFGLQNLRKRLNILFGENFELYTDRSNSFFTAFLKIPLS